ncbi:MAG: AraC family transcriptional regulator [Prevotella sp.]|jgi:AraC-like DNA-binding protein|nr:AraC family transcriptional regulator [Prevotella sp.]
MKHDLPVQEKTPLSEKDCFYIADRHKTEFTYPLHLHEDFELNFISNAAGVKRIVGDSEEIIGDYDLVLIGNKDLEHVWEQGICHSKDIREITIQFSPTLFYPHLLNKSQFVSIRNMFEKAEKGLSFPLPAIMKVYPVLDKLASLENSFYAVMDLFKVLYELSLFTNDAKELAEISYIRKPGNDMTDNDRLQDIRGYINDHYTEEIRLEQLAARAEMAPTAFSRFFKQHTGKSLSDYIIDIRLNQAARLLIDTVTPISKIYQESGFNNLSNFNRLFRKKKGCSPKEFRESYRKKKMVI